jgi:hypothetical protein
VLDPFRMTTVDMEYPRFNELALIELGRYPALQIPKVSTE